ncbi:hypothetical protein KFE94_02415 [bacterium SCSIO 12643]|nr:hypothetical protein KFE94_02415 [bacterium SCSIO 12643]
MDITYHNWLNIEITHLYFTDGICSNIHLNPFQNTSTICQNYNILLHQKQNTTSFFVGNKKSNYTQEDFLAITPMYFQITSDDLYFFNYTNISPTPDSLLFFETSSHINIQNGDYASAKNLISHKPLVFDISIPYNNVQIEVQPIHGRPFISESVDGTQNSEYNVNLVTQETGVYQILLNGEVEETFFISTVELNPNCIGILYLNPLEVISQNLSTPLKINFQTRSTYREYQIVVPTKRKINISSITIQGGNGEKYSGPKEDKILNGQTAQVFTSTSPLPLEKEPKTHPKLYLDYTNQYSNRTNQMEVLLPNPDTQNIKPYNLKGDSNSFYSSNIVYV